MRQAPARSGRVPARGPGRGDPGAHAAGRRAGARHAPVRGADGARPVARRGRQRLHAAPARARPARPAERGRATGEEEVIGPPVAAAFDAARQADAGRRSASRRSAESMEPICASSRQLTGQDRRSAREPSGEQLAQARRAATAAAERRAGTSQRRSRSSGARRASAELFPRS